MITLVLMAASYASELEVLIYDDNTETELVFQQYSDPEGLTWPQTYTIYSTGSVVVHDETAPSGKTRFCVDYRPASTAVWNRSCAVVDDADDDVWGVSWKAGQLAVAVYLNTTSGFDSSHFLDSGSFPGATSACSGICEDGSSCNASCPSSGCHVECNPSAHCQCL